MKKIEDFFSAYKNAVWQKDSKALLDLYAPDVIQFDTWNKGYYSNLSEWSPGIEHWLSSLGKEKVKVDFEQLKTFESNTISFASGLIEYQAVSPEGEILRSMKNRITIGFAKFNDEWKVVHQHISAPVNSKNLSAILEI